MVWVRCFDHLRRIVVTIERKGSEDLAKASAPVVKLPARRAGFLIKALTKITWRNLSPKPPKKDSIHPRAKHGGLWNGLVNQSYLGQAPKSMVQFRLENLLHNETLSSNRIATFWPKTVW